MSDAQSPQSLNVLIEDLNGRTPPSMNKLQPLSASATYPAWWDMIDVVCARIKEISAICCCIKSSLSPMDFVFLCYSAEGLETDVISVIRRNIAKLPLASVYGSGVGGTTAYAKIRLTGDFYDGGGGGETPFFPLVLAMTNNCPSNNGSYFFWRQSQDEYKIALTIYTDTNTCKAMFFCETLRWFSCPNGGNDAKRRSVSGIWTPGLTSSFGPAEGRTSHGNTGGSNKLCEQVARPVDPDICTFDIEIKYQLPQ